MQDFASQRLTGYPRLGRPRARVLLRARGRAGSAFHRQGGAALLMLVTLLILAGAAIFLEQANRGGVSARRTSELQDSRTLVDIRNSLVAWATTHAGTFVTPVPAVPGYQVPAGFPARFSTLGPGLFPCPDIDGDGWPDAPCTQGQIGRIPWRVMLGTDPGLGGDQAPWYSVGGSFAVHHGRAEGGAGGTLIDNERNFVQMGVQPGDLVQNLDDGRFARVLGPGPTNTELALDADIGMNTNPAYAITRPVNSESVGGLSIDGAGQVVAVLIAPGGPVGGQLRDAANINNPASYLEAANAVPDNQFVSAALGVPFNDVVSPITTGMVMGAVEPHVVSEIRTIFERFLLGIQPNPTDPIAPYPWLGRFVDPGSDFPEFGVASPGSASLLLVDLSTDFVVAGVRPGDPIRLVGVRAGSPVSATGFVVDVSANQLTVGSMVGTMNTIAAGDQYRLAHFFGEAGVREGLLPLRELGKPVATGMTVGWNIPIGTPGVSVSSRLAPLSDEPGHRTHLEYSVRRSVNVGVLRELEPFDAQGVADVGSGGFVLQDAAPVGDGDFLSLGVESGDRIVNLASGQAGTIVGVTLNSLQLSGVSFQPGDRYAIWSHGRCVWLDGTPRTLECYAEVETVPDELKFGVVAGPASAGADLDIGLVLADRAVQAGDMVVVNGAVGIIASTNGGTGTITIDPGTWNGGVINFQPDDNVDIRTTTFSLSGTAYPDSDGDPTTLEYLQPGINFIASGVVVGDVITNSTDGSAAVITAVAVNRITASLQGGTDDGFELGDVFEIRGAFFNPTNAVRRRYVFNFRFALDPAGTVSSRRGRRVRNLLTSNDPLLPTLGPAGTVLPSIFIEDLNGSDVQTGRVALRVLLGEEVNEGLTVIGLRYDLDPSRVVDTPPAAVPPNLPNLPQLEIEPWFLANDWHRLTYLAFSGSTVPRIGDVGTPDPPANNDCITGLGGDCLRVRLAGDQVALPNPIEDRSDVRALAIIAGPPLNAQDRTTGQIGAYFEAAPTLPLIGNDTPDDDDFVILARSPAFNDAVRVLSVQ